MKFFILALFLFRITCVAQDSQHRQVPKTSDPNQIKFITTDIDHFWQLVDALPSAKSQNDTLRFIRTYYLDKASAALIEYLNTEKTENQRNISQAYLNLLRQYPRFLRSIRKSTEQVRTCRPQLVTALQRLKQLDSSVVFPDVTVAIGIINTGERTFSTGNIYVGAELMAVSKQPAFDEFPATFASTLQTYSQPADKLPEGIFHEIIHANKRGGTGFENLLQQTIIEGAAVYMTVYVMGEKALTGSGGAGPLAPPYVEKQGDSIWQDFKVDMSEPAYGPKTARWQSGDPATGLPYQTLYYLGYKICKAYVDRAADKKQALRDIIHAGTNYRTLWEGSGL